MGLLGVLAIASCSGGDGGTTGRDVPDEGSDERVTPTDQDIDEQPFLGDSTGTWVQIQERAGAGRIFGEVYSDRVNRSFFLVLVQQDGENVSAEYQACDVEVENTEPNSQIVTTIPKALIESIPRANRPARVFQSGGTWRFEQPDHIEVRGIDLENPASDDLPLDRNDERIRDQDQDGQPGVTVYVSAPSLQFDIFVIQRIRTALTGTVVSNDRFEGQVQWTEDQVILGVENTTPEMAAQIVGASTVSVDQDPNKSRFRMVRVDAGTTCEEVVNRRSDWLTW
jgi:hypothetical protein